tara:strand:+ start:13802 stop:14044 length:243 start_codon:yes stop_codon:yes gene_type:complete
MTCCKVSQIEKCAITSNTIIPGISDCEVEYIDGTAQSPDDEISIQTIKRIKQTDGLIGRAFVFASPASGFATGQSVIGHG